MLSVLSHSFPLDISPVECVLYVSVDISLVECVIGGPFCWPHRGTDSADSQGKELWGSIQ